MGYLYVETHIGVSEVQIRHDDGADPTVVYILHPCAWFHLKPFERRRKYVSLHVDDNRRNRKTIKMSK